MKIKHKDIAIENDKPFANCKLGREKYATVLTQIVSNYSDGFVLAIDNPWGAGKTTFVKMWQQQLKNEGFETCYFNAWENDFESSPLIAILSELKSLNKKVTSDDKFKAVVKSAAAIAKGIVPILAEAIAKKYIETETINKAVKSIASKSADLLEEEINEYAGKKEKMKDFVDKLSQYIKAKGTDKPLVFMIDEIDRCKPDYAVQVLECIKHFFSVEGIVFVLSIDKTQLINSVKGFYGSENLDANNYLKRFIDLEYSIPAPNTKQHVDHLYEYFDYDKFFMRSERQVHSNLREDGTNLKKLAASLFLNEKLSLRNQEKIMALTRVVLSQFSHTEYVIPEVLLTLVYIHQVDRELFEKFLYLELNLQEMADHSESYVNKVLSTMEVDYKILVYSWIVFFYNNSYKRKNNRSEIFIGQPDINGKLSFNTSFDEIEVKRVMVYVMRYRENHFHLLNWLEKIALTEEVKL